MPVSKVQIGQNFYVKRRSGLWVEETTKPRQATAVERAEQEGIRIRVHYGDVETGRDWGDFHDVEGRVGRSIGRVVVPLLVSKPQSPGGSPIMTQHIVRLRWANRREGGDLYIHPKYHIDPQVIDGYDDDEWKKLFRKHFAPSKIGMNV